MALIITSSLQAVPSAVTLPEPGTTKVSFAFSGVGPVDVVYSVAEEQPVRFVEGGEVVRYVRDEALSSSGTRRVERRLRLCRRDGGPLEKPLRITAVVQKRGGDGTVVDRAVTACACSYSAEEGSATCP
ncbi:MAG: hypothetical protein WD423_10410 [Rhodothermales bacterium]